MVILFYVFKNNREAISVKIKKMQINLINLTL